MANAPKTEKAKPAALKDDDMIGVGAEIERRVFNKLDEEANAGVRSRAAQIRMILTQWADGELKASK